MLVFKKVNLILLCLALAVSVFVACDKGEDNTSDTNSETNVDTISDISSETSADTTTETSAETKAETTADNGNGGVAQNEWNAMLAASRFDNVTFTSNATFISGYSEKGPHINVFKLNGNSGTVDGEPMSGESLAGVKEMTMGTALAIVNDFNKFEYNATDDSYVAPENIVYNVSVMGYNAKITAKNVVVELDDDMNISKIVCNMTQEFEENGVAKTYVLDVVFTFDDYGTTEVESAAMSRDQWSAMISSDNFKNYTLTESQHIVYDNINMQQDSVFKVSGDKASADLTVDGQHIQYIVYTDEEAAAQKNSYEQIFRALLEEYDNFSYDKTANVYKNATEFTVNIPMDVYGASVALSMKNATVTVGEDGKLQKMECVYNQNTLTPEGLATATVDGVWTFSDYGTTVIE